MMRKADDGGIGGVDCSLPEAVLMGAVGRCHYYGSVFDGELILSVRCADVDGIIFIQRPRTVRGAVHCGGNKTRIRVLFPMKRRAAARRMHVMR
mgnify:CR=1 FL=1